LAEAAGEKKKQESEENCFGKRERNYPRYKIFVGVVKFERYSY
jgi:hypothetical protein